MYGKDSVGIRYWVEDIEGFCQHLLSHVHCLSRTLFMLAVLLTSAPSAIAHSGGTPVLADVAAGPYRLFAYVQPEPVIVGETHVAVAVTIPATDKAANGLLLPVTDAQVLLHWLPSSQPDAAFTVELPVQSTAGDTFYERDLRIPFADRWRVTLEVTGTQGQGSANFELLVVATRSINWGLVTGAGAALLLLIGLIIVWQRLQRLPKE
jgi:hypothetical protein